MIPLNPNAHFPWTPIPKPNLLASLDLVLNRLVRLPRNLGHEVHVHQLALLRRPLAIRVPVKHQLVRPGVSDLGGRVRERAVGAPRDLVARRLLDEEGLGAPHVLVRVDALVHRVVEHAARGDLVGGAEEGD